MKFRRGDIVGRYIPETLVTRERGEAFAPANIALVKYWGKRDVELNLAQTSSLSISLGQLGTTTVITASDGADRVIANGRRLDNDDVFAARLLRFVDLFRAGREDQHRLLIETNNSVPTAAGLASSASGFAALTKALDAYFRLGLPMRVLSALARIGSGSASRSIYDGFVEWHRGRSGDGMDSFAEPLAVTWPDLRVGLLVVSSKKKPIDSTTAMNRTVETSELYRNWPVQVERDLKTIRTAILDRDFDTMGRVAEHNAMSMHATMLSAWPPISYWQPETVKALQQVWQLRASGVSIYVTMDAGPNLKLLFEAKDQTRLEETFPHLQMVTPFST